MKRNRLLSYDLAELTASAALLGADRHQLQFSEGVAALKHLEEMEEIHGRAD